jgi:hypothetical protein
MEHNNSSNFENLIVRRVLSKETMKIRQKHNVAREERTLAFSLPLKGFKSVFFLLDDVFLRPLFVSC